MLENSDQISEEDSDGTIADSTIEASKHEKNLHINQNVNNGVAFQKAKGVIDSGKQYMEEKVVRGPTRHISGGEV